MRWGLVYWGRLEGRQGLELESGLGGMEMEGSMQNREGLGNAGGRV